MDNEQELIKKYILSIPSEKPFIHWLKHDSNISHHNLYKIFIGYHLSNHATHTLLDNITLGKTLINQICHKFSKNDLLTHLSLSLLDAPIDNYINQEQKIESFNQAQYIKLHEFLDKYSNLFPRDKKQVFLRNIHNFLLLGVVNILHFKPEISVFLTPLNIISGLSLGPIVAKLAMNGKYFGVAESYEKVFTQNKEKKREFKSFSILTEQIHDYLFLYKAIKVIKNLHNKNEQLLGEKLSFSNDKPALSSERFNDILYSLCEAQYLNNITQNTSVNNIGLINTKKKVQKI